MGPRVVTKPPSRARTLRRTATLTAFTIGGAGAALSLSSAVYAGVGGKQQPGVAAPMQWAVAAASGKGGPAVHLGGAVGAIPGLAGLALAGFAVAGWRREGAIQAPTRSENDIHGHSNWATEAQQRRRFWRVDEEYGCMVLAEIRRRDLEPVHGIPYDPRDQSTWGEGGKGDLLVDDATIRATHVIGIAGSGIGKSQTALMSLAHPRFAWRGDVIVGDPKGELGRFTKRIRERLFGHRVFEVGIGKDGINIFDGLDPRSPYFEVDVQALVDRMFTEKSKGGSSSDEGKWELWGKTLVCALVAHMCYDPAWPQQIRDARTLRDAISQSEGALRDTLRGIGDMSPCRFAREQARSVLVDAKDTWSGVYINAQAGTSWLSNSAYADMVSDRSFRASDLGHGDATVYIQLSPKTLKGTPNVARVIYGTLLEALYDKGGKIRGRVLCEIDEAYQLGRMEVLERIRDLGRDAKITLRLWYQSTGQITEVWGEGGKEAWYASTAYRMYAGISGMPTAKEAAELCGRYTAKVKQTGDSQSRTGKALLDNSVTHGSSSTETETVRELQMAHEFLQDWADDEVLIFNRGMPPIRAGLPLAYRRPEVDGLIKKFAAEEAAERKEAVDPVALRSVLGMATEEARAAA